MRRFLKANQRFVLSLFNNLFFGSSCRRSDIVRITWRYFILFTLFNKQFKSESINGHKLYIPDYKSFYYIFEEIFIREIYQINTDHPVKTILDFGANIGVSVLYFLQRYPEAKIHAVEAVRSTFDHLTTNVSFSDRVTLYQQAVTASSEPSLSIQVHDSRDGFAGNTTSAHRWDRKPDTFHTEEVPTCNYASFLAGHQPVDIVKIDIEGGEATLFDEAVLSTGAVSHYLIEYHHNIPESGTDLARFAGQFTKAGFGLNITVDRPLLRNFVFKPESMQQDIILHFHLITASVASDQELQP